MESLNMTFENPKSNISKALMEFIEITYATANNSLENSPRCEPSLD